MDSRPYNRSNEDTTQEKTRLKVNSVQDREPILFLNLLKFIKLSSFSNLFNYTTNYTPFRLLSIDTHLKLTKELLEIMINGQIFTYVL